MSSHPPKEQAVELIEPSTHPGHLKSQAGRSLALTGVGRDELHRAASTTCCLNRQGRGEVDGIQCADSSTLNDLLGPIEDVCGEVDELPVGPIVH